MTTPSVYHLTFTSIPLKSIGSIHKDSALIVIDMHHYHIGAQVVMNIRITPFEHLSLDKLWVTDFKLVTSKY